MLNFIVSGGGVEPPVVWGVVAVTLYYIFY